MSHFALLCPEDAGHLFAQRCRGKRVGAARASHHRHRPCKHRPLAEQLDLPFIELKTGGIPYPSAHFLWLSFAAFDAGWMIGLRCGFEWDARMLLRNLPPIIKEMKIDGFLIDQNFPAGGTTAELAGLPFVTICSALMWHEEPSVPPAFTSWPCREGWLARVRNRLGFAAWHWYMRPVMKVINRERKKHGLPKLARVDDAFSPLAQISNLCTSSIFPATNCPRNSTISVHSLPIAK